MDNVNPVLGRVITALRQSARLSQEELADRAGIHRTYVSQLERGLKSPTVVMLLRLARALDAAPSKIIRQVESELKIGTGTK